jgi:hypothetical protein
MIYHLEITKRGQIDRCAVLGPGADECNRTRDNARYKQFIIAACRSSRFIRVDFDVLFFCVAVIGTVALLPVDVWWLGIF